jgi:hypothetical protein
MEENLEEQQKLTEEEENAIESWLDELEVQNEQNINSYTLNAEEESAMDAWLEEEFHSISIHVCNNDFLFRSLIFSNLGSKSLS